MRKYTLDVNMIELTQIKRALEQDYPAREITKKVADLHANAVQLEYKEVYEQYTSGPGILEG